MGLFSNLQLNSMDDLFLSQLKDLYDAENQLLKALPLMADAASSTQLKQSFNLHLQQTQQQVERLEQAFRMLGRDAERETCAAMKGLIAEGNEMIAAQGDPDVKDAGLIAAAQRVEHYEIAGYGTARTFAYRVGRPEIARLLETTLQEEKQTDQLLTQMAESSINIRAEQS
jgi:ferritin-like metal-binding protein YciE